MLDSESTDLVPVTSAGAFDLATTDPATAFQKMGEVVRLAAQSCKGPAFVVSIQGKKYPKVEWWSTVGFSLGLVPREASSRKLDTPEGEIVYESVVEVWRGEQLVTRASAICSSKEKRWGHADEYAVKSMATTRAIGKAYRVPLSFLAVMSGLEPTPSDEIPPGGFEKWDNPQAPEPELPPLEPEVMPHPHGLSSVKQALAEALMAWPPDKRDAVVQKCSMIVEDGKPVLGRDGKPKCIESVDKALSEKISDKWTGATLQRVREMANRIAAKQGA